MIRGFFRPRWNGGRVWDGGALREMTWNYFGINNYFFYFKKRIVIRCKIFTSRK